MRFSPPMNKLPVAGYLRRIWLRGLHDERGTLFLQVSGEQLPRRLFGVLPRGRRPHWTGVAAHQAPAVGQAQDPVFAPSIAGAGVPELLRGKWNLVEVKQIYRKKKYRNIFKIFQTRLSLFRDAEVFILKAGRTVGYQLSHTYRRFTPIVFEVKQWLPKKVYISNVYRIIIYIYI